MKALTRFRLSTSPSASLRWLAIAVLCVATAACRVGDLLPPRRGIIDRFSNGNALMDSAMVGSTIPRVDTIRIMNEGDGELRWAAQVKHASPWLTLQPDTGIVGLTAPLQARADPTGLALGVYRDTIVIVATNTGATAELPVVFRIHP